MLQIARKSVTAALMSKAAIHTVAIVLRFSPTLGARIDDWRRRQPDLPSRSEAIRRLVERGLQAA